ncbi:unnamed protein product [Notodromas monacha]|uniref:Uncharacterized protein n=1 Tax=Notodromas monacha TaxID=399045 RepID=A0A7R9GCZ6_9CRUS|nr:unnamed protein product [Notodromas monacha]CAG0916621.1 unnamed protein product [Notodromas monacha]
MGKVSTFALLCLVVAGIDGVVGAQAWGRLSGNGYDGVLVSVSDRVPEDQCHQVISNLKVKQEIVRTKELTLPFLRPDKISCCLKATFSLPEEEIFLAQVEAVLTLWILTNDFAHQSG